MYGKKHTSLNKDNEKLKITNIHTSGCGKKVIDPFEFESRTLFFNIL